MKNYKYILTHSSGNLTVEYNPIKWNNFNIVFARSKRYHSVLRSQVADSEFPKDGKAYIDNIYDVYGIDTDIGCEIQYLDKSDFTYTTLFEGIIDLSEWVKIRDTTIVKIADSSNMAKFIARDEIFVPISKGTTLDGATMSAYTYLNTMTVEGVRIESRSLYDDDTNLISQSTSDIVSTTYYRGVTNVDWDVNDIGSDATLPAVVLLSGSGPIYTNNGSENIDIKYRVVTSVLGSITTSGGSWNYAIKSYTGLNGVINGINISNSGSGAGASPYAINSSYDSGELEVTLTPGDTLEFYHEYDVGIPGGLGTATVTSLFDYLPIYVELFEIIDPAPDSEVEMPLLHELGAKVLEYITDIQDPLNAPLIGRTDSEPRTYGSDGDYSLSGVASGNMLRQVDFDDKPLVTNFADYFKSLDALYNLGMYYDQDNEEFVISAKSDYYKDTKIITLGEVKDLEVTVAREEYFNNILTGFKDKLDYEEVNGNQNFNVNGKFANDGKRIQNTLDIQSAYHGDDYGIELSRQNAINLQTSEDSRYDDQLFIITGQRGVSDYITLQGYDDFASIVGVYTPETRLNLNITPKRNMNRNLNRLSIPLFKSEGETPYLEKQYELDLRTRKSGESFVIEKDDLAYADLEDPLYYPELYNFTAPLTNEHVAQLLSDPHGYVEFTYVGDTYKGFIEEVSTQPFNRQGNWTLVRTGPTQFDDWFLPSLDELNQMYVNLHLQGVGDFTTNSYWASSEISAAQAYRQRFSDGDQASASKVGNTIFIRPCRRFTDTAGLYSLRDTGPAGGLIFYIDGTTYYESYTSDFGGSSPPWSNVTLLIGTTGTAIGSGVNNTTAIINQAGHTESAAEVCNDLVITN